jgi:hypothetical protein
MTWPWLLSAASKVAPLFDALQCCPSEYPTAALETLRCHIQRSAICGPAAAPSAGPAAAGPSAGGSGGEHAGGAARTAPRAPGRAFTLDALLEAGQLPGSYAKAPTPAGVVSHPKVYQLQASGQGTRLRARTCASMRCA